VGQASARRVLEAIQGLLSPQQTAAVDALQLALRSCSPQLQYEEWQRVARAIRLEAASSVHV
jgi:hypothetical protein